MISPNVVPDEEHGAAGAHSTMTETFQILILLLAVISVVGLIAKRLQIPACHSPCDHRRWARPDPGAAEPATRARSCLAARAAADHLLGRGEDELEGVPLQPAPYRAAGDRLCRVHDDRRRRGDPFPVGLSLGGRLRPGRHHFASRLRRAAGDRATNAASKAPPRRSRGRGTGERRNGARPLSLRGHGGERGIVLVRRRPPAALWLSLQGRSSGELASAGSCFACAVGSAIPASRSCSRS